jgi:hypothetical protein
MNTGRISLPPHAVVLAILLAYAPSGPAWAQSIRGTVVEDGSGTPVGTVDVAVVGGDDSILAQYVTDENGRFVARMSEAGSYRLRVTRLGYQSSTSNEFELEEGQSVLAELRLQLSPVMLDGLEAIVEGQSIALARVGFYHRERMGFAQMKTPDELIDKPPLDFGDLFQGMNGVVFDSGSGDVYSSRTNMRTRPCRPSISINGLVVQMGHRTGSSFQARPIDGLEAVVGGGRDLELQSGWKDHLSILDVAAIEVFPGAGGLPDFVSGSVSPCGAVLIWTKGYVERPDPRREDHYDD